MPTFKSVSPSKIYLPFKNMKKDDIVINGLKFVGRSPNKFGKDNFDFEDEKGVISVLNHCNGLGFKMDLVAPGTIVRITYRGKKISEKGDMKGKEFHDFDVEVDTESLAAPEEPSNTSLSLGL